MASRKDDVILEGEFVLPLKKKAVYHVTLTRNGLFLHLVSNNSTTYEEKIVQISDIVGCHSLEHGGNIELSTPTTSTRQACADQSTDFKNNEIGISTSRSFQRAIDASSCGFVVFAYPFRKKLFSSRKIRTRQVTVFETSDDKNKIAESWRNVINCLCRDLPVSLNDIPSCVPPPRGRMLLLINPFSGSGKANTIFKNEIAPMLYEACIPYKAVVTEYAGHAGELMKTIKLSEWYGVVIVSGDGLLFETINGIMQRDDWASSVKFPVGCLPAGSGNALCCSINYSAGEPLDAALVLHSTFILVKHRVVPMDLVVVHIPDRTIFSFLSVTWGIVADIDFESEKYRKLGEARFTVGAIKRIIGLRSYRGRVSFLPVAEYTPKLTATSSKVLAKIRRFSLQSSRSSSKSTLNSLDSRSSNSPQLSNSNSKTNIGLSEHESGDAAESTVDSFYKEDTKVERSIKIDNSSSDPNRGDHSRNLELMKERIGVLSIECRNSDGIALDIKLDGSGDAKDLNVVDQSSTRPDEMVSLNPAFQPNEDLESACSEVLPTSSLPVTQIESIANNSSITQGALVKGNKEYSSTSYNLHLNNSNSHTSSSHMVNGCSVENNHRMTILSDAQEVRVEQETYHVKKADHFPVPTPLLVPLDQDVPGNWVILDENFVLAVAVYQTHLGSDMFVAPDAHLCDGHIHLMMVREGIPRNALLNLFLTFDQGRHIHSPYVEVVKVLAFRIEPASKDGNLMIDGERFDPHPIQGQILPGLARVMAIK